MLKRTSGNLAQLAGSLAVFVCLIGVSDRSSFCQVGSKAAESKVAVVSVDVNPRHLLNSFDPDRSLGSSIDVLSREGIDKVYTPHIIQEALSAGWGPITYRNNTELRMAAWHWTENGTWSDPVHQSGYFTGSSELKESLRYIFAGAEPVRARTAIRRAASAVPTSMKSGSGAREAESVIGGHFLGRPEKSADAIETGG